MKYYIYQHKRNDTGEVFYVGKGEGNRYRSKVGRTAYWLNIVNKHGYTAEIIEYFETEELAFRAEENLIAKIGRKDLGKGSLVNLSDGGEGASGAIRTPEQKETYSRTTWMRTDAGKASVTGDKNPSKKPKSTKKVKIHQTCKNPPKSDQKAQK